MANLHTWSSPHSGYVVSELTTNKSDTASNCAPSCQALFLITTQGIPGLKEPQKWSPECKDFLAKCLAKDVAVRPDAAALIKVGVIRS